MKRLNIKLVAILFASVVLFCGGVYALHSFQRGRTAESLKIDVAQAWEDAKAYKDSEDPDEDTLIEKLTRTAELHRLYISYRQNDAAAWAGWGLIEADLAIADKPRKRREHLGDAVGLMEQSLQRPQEGLDEAGRQRLDEVRRWLVNTYMLMSNFQTAQQHLEFLLKEHPEEAQLKQLQAECQIGLQQYDQAVAILKELIAADPTQVKAYFRLATVLNSRLNNTREAEAMIEAAVAANPDSFEVYLERARHFHRTEKLDAAKEDILKALSYPEGADDQRVIVAAAEIAMASKDYEMAREQLLRGVQLHPTSEVIYQDLYFLSVAENDRDAAIQWLEKGMEEIRQSPTLRTYHADQMLQTGNLEKVRENIKRLREMPIVRSGYLAYLEGRLAMQERNWIEARNKLEEARRTMPEGMLPQIDMSLAHCHLQLGQTGDALREYEKLIAAHPTMIEPHVRRAEILYGMKRWDESYREYKGVVSSLGLEEFVKRFGDWGRLLDLADRMNDLQLKEEIAAYVSSGDAGELTAMLARAQALLGQRRNDEARELLETYLAANAEQPRVWLVLANLAARTGTTEDALAVLDRAEKAMSPTATTRMARVEYVSLLPMEQAKPQLETLAQQAEQLDPAERERVYGALASAFLRIGEMDRAIGLWKTLVEARPSDPKLLLTLFDVELARGNQEQVQAAIDRIRANLGSGSEYTHFAEAARLISQIEKKPGDEKPLSQNDVNRLNEASRLVQLAKRERPHWHDATRLEATIAGMRGDMDKAIERYLEAVNQGERSPRVLQRLVALLYAADRKDEIDEIIDLLRDTPGSEALVEGWESLVSGGLNYSKIIEKLSAEVQANPSDVNKQFQLAQMQVLAQEFEAAETTLRKVIELNDGTVDLAWSALVQVLVNTKRMDDAKAVTAEAKLKLPPERAAKVLSRCYEMLGDHEQAEQTYVAAWRNDPADLGALRSLATYYLRMAQQDQRNAAEHLKKADPHLNELIAKGDGAADEHVEHVRWARRAMADRLAGTISMLTPAERSYGGFKRALELLDANTAQGEEPLVVDRLMKATVMAMRSEKAFRRDAVAQFEAIKRQQELRPAELFTLANLYERIGQWDDCRQTMNELLRRSTDPNHLAQMIHMILRNDDPGDDGTASSYLVHLKQQAPDSYLTAIAEAQYLISTNRANEGIQRMQRLIPRPPTNPNDLVILRDVAVYLEHMEQIEAAEDLWREYVAARPDAVLLLASFVGRHGKLDEAFDLCDEQLAKNDQLIGSVIQVGLTSIRSQRVSSTPSLDQRHFDRVDAWFQKAVETYPASVTLKLQRAELYDIHGRYEDAEKMYRSLSEDASTPENYRAVARNNLAFMVSLRYKNEGAGRRALEHAEKMIDEAIAVRGLTSDLLDTRGMVHLAMENTAQAIDDLKVSIDDNPSGSKLFHLAMAYDQADQPELAVATLKRAIEDYGLESSSVAPLEREKYDQLVARLGMD